MANTSNLRWPRSHPPRSTLSLGTRIAMRTRTLTTRINNTSNMCSRARTGSNPSSNPRNSPLNSTMRHSNHPSSLLATMAPTTARHHHHLLPLPQRRSSLSILVSSNKCLSPRPPSNHCPPRPNCPHRKQLPYRPPYHPASQSRNRPRNRYHTRSLRQFLLLHHQGILDRAVGR